jgi:hypothetical protein
VGAFFNVWAVVGLAVVAGAYVVGAALGAISIAARESSPGLALRIAVAFPLMHLSYGAGFLWELVRRLATPTARPRRVRATIRS